ncbi:hypothetical protein M406DRAFT_329640 [Cryphonectria parasitica EP155]|uniref:Uncharacterized protein n=1 Tax=Cryphonectria parasitica (strain ATCC 38755 / EP155) TaxID=660469 RepID=A0A9P4Y3C2_CRYP1|nr:uncharacterized protein M406DRAFT_329640 [Cryphonectria parasitica EP155]KAF3765773.1 hypothetical protein M406DRAFT_329640 [Cryphonectria parasitica EP155]
MNTSQPVVPVVVLWYCYVYHRVMLLGAKPLPLQKCYHTFPMYHSNGQSRLGPASIRYIGAYPWIVRTISFGSPNGDGVHREYSREHFQSLVMDSRTQGDGDARLHATCYYSVQVHMLAKYECGQRKRGRPNTSFGPVLEAIHRPEVVVVVLVMAVAGYSGRIRLAIPTAGTPNREEATRLPTMSMRTHAVGSSLVAFVLMIIG